MIEKEIAEKIHELTQYSILFIEDEFHQLTPAGKYETGILTAAIVMQLLREKDVFVIHKVDMGKFMEFLEPGFQDFFKKMGLEYQISNRNIEKFNDQFLDTFLVSGNDNLITQDSSFIKMSIRRGIVEFSKELQEYKKGFERYNKGQGRVVIPELICNCLFVSPFLCLEPNIEETTFLVSKKLKEISRISQYSFITIPAQLSENLANLMNRDSVFVNKIKSGSKAGISSNQNCYIATLAYGNINHPKVERYRYLRDNYLVYSVLGRKFIKVYYKFSPWIVSKLEDYNRLNKAIKRILDLILVFTRNR